MVSEDDLRAWLDRRVQFLRRRDPATPGSVGVQAVPGAWIAWVTDVPTDTPADGEGERLVFADTPAGDPPVWSAWPAWTPDRIAEQLTLTAADDRFPPAVRAWLEDAGWHEGRTVGDDVLDQVTASLPDLPGVELHPAARAALREFGGLRIRTAERHPLLIAPVPEVAWDGHDLAAVAAGLQNPSCPVGYGPTHVNGLVVMGADGEVVYSSDALYALGRSFDDALVSFLTEGALPQAD